MITDLVKRSRTFLTTNTGLISGSSLLGSALAFVSLPYLAWKCGPEAFGVFTKFQAILIVAGVVACLRYDQAIALPEEEDRAKGLALLSLICALVLALTVGGVVMALSAFGVGVFAGPWAQVMNVLLVTGVLIAGLFQVVSGLLVRSGELKGLALRNVIQAVVMTTAHLGMAAMSLGGVGLVGGVLVGRLAGILPRGRQLTCDLLKARSIWNTSRLWILAKEYRNFPLYATPSGLLMVLGSQLAPFLFVALFGETAGGLFGVANRIIGIPLVILGQALGAVYLSEASEIVRTEPARLLPYYNNYTRRLAKISIAVGSFGILAGTLAPFLLGSEWAEVRWHIYSLSLVGIFQFVVSPISVTTNLISIQDRQLRWDLFRLVLTFFSICVPALLKWPLLASVISYSVLIASSYALYFRFYSQAVVKFAANPVPAPTDPRH